MISLRDTAVILRKRGNAMQKAVPEGKGSMVAVLGLNSENVRDLLITSKCDRHLVQVANDNDPSQVVISGEKKEEKVEEQEGYYHKESSSGSFTRAVPLPTEVHLDKVEAKFEKGKLVVTLPKSDIVKEKTREIPIHS